MYALQMNTPPPGSIHSHPLLGLVDQRQPNNAIERSLAFIVENFSEDISLSDLASAAGITRFNLCRAFQRRLRVTPMKWLWTFRTLLASEFIRFAPSWALTDVAFNCGFTSSAHFSRAFQGLHGVSPSQFRKKIRATALDSANDGQRLRLISEFDQLYANNRDLTRNALRLTLAHAERCSS